jgi:putative hemin transport protein
MQTELSTLQESFDILIKREPKIRLRDVSRILRVGERDLIALQESVSVTPLEIAGDQLLPHFKEFGSVMCLTRNDIVVHERRGEFLDVSCFHGMGQVVGPDIDLRLFFSHWKSIFAVVDSRGSEVKRSIQIFDSRGDAIFKVFLQEGSSIEKFTSLIESFGKAGFVDSGNQIPVEQEPLKRIEDNSQVDTLGFLKEWGTLQDTHQFFTLLQTHKVNRHQALHIAQGKFAWKLTHTALEILFKEAKESQMEIMIFVGNPGAIQIHTGLVKNIAVYREWFNVLDPLFNLHIDFPKIAEVWRVDKPTKDGVVTSIEFFDYDRENVMMIFGKRKPGQQECSSWRKLATGLS